MDRYGDNKWENQIFISLVSSVCFGIQREQSGRTIGKGENVLGLHSEADLWKSHATCFRQGWPQRVWPVLGGVWDLAAGASADDCVCSGADPLVGSVLDWGELLLSFRD